MSDLELGGKTYTQADLARIVAKVAAQSKPKRRKDDSDSDLSDLKPVKPPILAREPRTQPRERLPQKPRPVRARPRPAARTNPDITISELPVTSVVNPPNIFSGAEQAQTAATYRQLNGLHLRSPLASVVRSESHELQLHPKASDAEKTAAMLLSKNASLSYRKQQNILDVIAKLVRG